MTKKFKFGSGNNKGLLIFGAIVVVAVIAYFVFFSKQGETGSINPVTTLPEGASIYGDVSVLIANIYFIYFMKLFNLTNSNETSRMKFETLANNFIRSTLKSKGYTYEEITAPPETELNSFIYPTQAFINIKKGATLLFNNNLEFIDKTGKIIKEKKSPSLGGEAVQSFDITFQNSELKDIFTITIDINTFDIASFGPNATQITMLNVPKITWKI
jgi:hypothetical protein